MHYFNKFNKIKPNLIKFFLLNSLDKIIKLVYKLR